MQASAGDKLRFKRLSLEEADALRQSTDKQVALLAAAASAQITASDAEAQFKVRCRPCTALPQPELTIAAVSNPLRPSLSHSPVSATSAAGSHPAATSSGGQCKK